MFTQLFYLIVPCTVNYFLFTIIKWYFLSFFILFLFFIIRSHFLFYFFLIKIYMGCHALTLWRLPAGADNEYVWYHAFKWMYLKIDCQTWRHSEGLSDTFSRWMQCSVVVSSVGWIYLIYFFQFCRMHVLASIGHINRSLFSSETMPRLAASTSEI